MPPRGRSAGRGGRDPPRHRRSRARRRARCQPCAGRGEAEDTLARHATLLGTTPSRRPRRRPGRARTQALDEIDEEDEDEEEDEEDYSNLDEDSGEERDSETRQGSEDHD